MSFTEDPTISVVIPVYNGGEDFRRCLIGLSQTKPAPDEIIVVSDGDTDGSGRLAETFGAKVLRMPVRGGPARARNLGARAARGEILFFIDADVLARSDVIAQVHCAFKSEADIAAVFGSYDDEPGATNFLSQYKNLFHHYVHQGACEDAFTFFGACGAIRRETFLALEGFDESYGHPSIEDIELGYRLKRAGYQIRLWKNLQVKHLKQWGVASLLRSDFVDRALPWTELIVRDRRFLNDLNLRFSSRLSVVLVYGLLAALVGAWWWSGFLVFAALAILGLLALNTPTYRFFYGKRGLRFMLQSIPWHWFYYLYGGLAFAIGLIRFELAGRRSAGIALPVQGGDSEKRQRPQTH
jgi:GT2 family glycosyltransferase